MYVTLDELRAHLNIEYADEDSYLRHLIETSEAAVELWINRPYSDVLVSDRLPAPLRHAILLEAARLYAHREGETARTMEVPFTLSALILPYRLER